MRWIHLLKWPLFIGIIIGLLISNLLALNKLSKLSEEHRHQSDENVEAAKIAAQNAEAQTQRIITYMNCFAEFFSRPDREELRIESIEECVIRKEAQSSPQQTSQSASTESNQATDQSSSNGNPPKPNLSDRAVNAVCRAVTINNPTLGLLC